MKLTQSWVGYLDRSYEQIKASLLRRLSTVAPEITDHTESNPLVIIISMFSGVAEMLNLYIDSLARELYLGTARKFSSVARIAKLIDYPVKAKSYATVQVLFTLRDSNGDLIANPGGNIVIPKGSGVKASNSDIAFLLDNDIIIKPGLSSVYGTASQYSNLLGETLGNTSGANNQRIEISPAYVHKSLRVYVNGIAYGKLYNTLGQMSPTTKGYVIEVTEEGRVFLVFGDNINGLKPGAGLPITADYKITEGTLGNFPPNSIDTLVTTLTLSGGLQITITNPDYASGGTDFETIEEIRNRAPRSLRSLERAVTYQDFIDLAIMQPGVGSADIKYCCGKYVDLYIAPNSAGVATFKLLSDVQNVFNLSKMVTTQIKVYPSGITKIWVKGVIYGKPLVSEEDIYNQLVEALDKEYGYSTILINKKFSVSDIINTIENLTLVERAEIEQVRILPYVRPVNDTKNTLSIIFTGVPISDARHTYLIRYKESTDNFDIYRDSFYLTTIDAGVNYNDAGITTFQISAGTYEDNDEWEFVVFPSYPEIFPTNLFNINDFSAPIIEVDPFISENITRNIFSDLTIVAQGSNALSLPPCN